MNAVHDDVDEAAKLLLNYTIAKGDLSNYVHFINLFLMYF